MYLEKKDVSLYYETRGQGEPLILVHGVIVDAGLFAQTAEILSRCYQVITFDRRGTSRSALKTDPHFDMDEQADDILDLMNALGLDSAYFVGASAGAVVAQYFFQKYPDKVRHLIMYEPAILGYLMDEPWIRDWIEEMRQLVEKGKINTAILHFARNIASFDTRSPAKPPEMFRREMGNHVYALTQEFPGLVAYRPDIEAMKRNADRITIAAGEKSGETIYAHGARRLAEDIGKQADFYPGYHNLPYDLPREFAICILGTLLLDGKKR